MLLAYLTAPEWKHQTWSLLLLCYETIKVHSPYSSYSTMWPLQFCLFLLRIYILLYFLRWPIVPPKHEHFCKWNYLWVVANGVELCLSWAASLPHPLLDGPSLCPKPLFCYQMYFLGISFSFQTLSSTYLPVEDCNTFCFLPAEDCNTIYLK